MQNNQVDLITLKEAARYLKYTYRGFWGKLKKSYEKHGTLPKGVYDISETLGVAHKRVYRINIQEFLYSNHEHNKKLSIHKTTIENACKSIETAYFKSLSKKTLWAYKRAVELALSFFHEKEINTVNLYDFITFLREEKQLKDNSIKKYIKGLSVVFKQSVFLGFVKTNPLANFDKSFLKEEKRIEYLKPEEKNLFIKENKKLDGELTNAFEFAIETGLRANEQTKLIWHNIDFEEQEAYITETKTKQNRLIALSNRAVEILLENKKQGFEKPFKAYSNGYPYEHQRWKKAKLRANITRNFHWHDLRHTFGTYCVKGLHTWLNQPINLQQTATLMGHKDIKMTTRYAHLDISDLKKIIKRRWSKAFNQTS